MNPLAEVINREMEILHGCVRDVLTEEFGEPFHEEIAWSVVYWSERGWPWCIRCGGYGAEFWCPGRSAEEACQRFQTMLNRVRFNRDQVRLNQQDGT
jgi:hypothetical protein